MASYLQQQFWTIGQQQQFWTYIELRGQETRYFEIWQDFRKKIFFQLRITSGEKNTMKKLIDYTEPTDQACILGPK